MGAPPWDDLERYRRNSPPYIRAQREDPLLIIHGDQDFINLSQDEEFYTALWGLQLPVRFVRYWGEWHGIESKANTIDEWNEMLGWLKRYDPNSGVVGLANRAPPEP
jgi:dipeptidyl aminopeptidase/acylaminoacyl peptidase